MATAAGLVNLALTPGVWIQVPTQTATSISIPPIGGLQVSLDGGVTYIVQKSGQQPNTPQIRQNMNEFYFRIFGAPITITIGWAS